ncbi:AAA family ATPase, partial [Streptomyces indicus]
VLEIVGLTDAGRRRVDGYSLGMRQRLALAAALLGDPQVLILDEPANGLDPEGIAWLRQFLRRLAAEGRTVLVSSHILSEMQQLVDRVVIIHRGRPVHEGPLTDLPSAPAQVSVRSPQATELRLALEQATTNATSVRQLGPETLTVAGLASADIGRLAHRERIELHELAAHQGDLERLFFALTKGADHGAGRE